MVMAAIQPWSAAGAEKPMVTGLPGSVLVFCAPFWAWEPEAGFSLEVHPASTAVAPSPAADNRKTRRAWDFLYMAYSHWIRLPGRWQAPAGTVGEGRCLLR